MKVDWAMLANYAEQNGGLAYIQGGSWDTITVHAPIPSDAGAPPGLFTVIQGYFTARIGFHQTESGDHSITVVIRDSDGAEIAKAEGEARVQRTPGLPAQWLQHIQIVIPLTGIGLPKAGEYVVHLLVDGKHETDVPFRVIKGY